MFNLIYQYFTQTGTLSLNGLGSFQSIHHPPIYQTIQQNFIAPGNTIFFSSPDELQSASFIAFVAKQKNISNQEAKEMVEQHIAILQKQLSDNGSIDFGTMGTLQKKADGSVDFISKTCFDDFDFLAAEKVIRRNEAHNITVGENEKTNIEMEALLNQEPLQQKKKWWIAAIVIAIASVAYLFYYYFINNGF